MAGRTKINKPSKISQQKTKKKEKGVGRNGNLIPPKKGEPSRNPKGRKKKEFTIPDILEKLLKEESSYKPGSTRLSHICIKAIEQAEGGCKDARNWVADRFEGKALERVLKQKTNDILEIK